MTPHPAACGVHLLPQGEKDEPAPLGECRLALVVARVGVGPAPLQGREQRLTQNARSSGEQGQKIKEQGDQGTAQTASSRQADQSGTTKGAESRKADAKVSNEKLDERKEAGESSASSASSGAGGSSREKGDIKADADKAVETARSMLIR